MTYYDANTEKHETIPTMQCLHNQAGWTGEVEYGVLYLLSAGRYLTCVRHKDRGDLATDLHIHSGRRPEMKSDLYVGGQPIPRRDDGSPDIALIAG